MLGISLVSDGGRYIYKDLQAATYNGQAVNLSLWLRNNVGLESNGSKWADSSGNNNHAQQTSDGNRAAVSGGGLDFTPGNSDHYDLDNAITIAENQGFCLAVVIDQETISNNTILSKDADDQFQIVNNGRFRFRANDDTDTITNFDVDGTPFDGNKMILLLNRSAGASNTFRLFKNGTQLTPNTDTSTNEAGGENPYGFDINVVGANAGGSQYFDGKILELAFWSRSLTLQEIVDVNNYLKQIHEL
tara:strand:+ start:351 stop:1088 length:738 start_codon:yes stop_codon:yes gene_type:complete